jgi:hypothetical protein
MENKVQKERTFKQKTSNALYNEERGDHNMVETRNS